MNDINNYHCSVKDEIFLTVNWHIFPFCNYRCRYCYQTFSNNQEWINDPNISKQIIKVIKDGGIYKLTFSGGEPTLHPYITKLIKYAKSIGLTTSIVTNGSKIDYSFMKKVKSYLDIIAISINSSKEHIELALGCGQGKHVSMALDVCDLIHKYGIRLKLNTIVSRMNYMEDMRDIVKRIVPERWKIFQFLYILGENDAEENNLSISQEQFHEFIKLNSKDIYTPIFAEDNDAMTSSYIMIDPLGNIMQNHFGQYIKGQSLLEFSLLEAINHIGFDKNKYIQRGGSYR